MSFSYFHKLHDAQYYVVGIALVVLFKHVYTILACK